MYKKDIKVLDCTIRDGGLMNKWQFSKELVKSVYESCLAAGVDYMEIGYISSEDQFSRDEYGAWKFCSEADVREIVGENNTNMKLSVLADIGRISFDDIRPKSESLIDMFRVACYDHQIDKAIELAHHVIDKGYEATINLMAVSKVTERSLNEVLSDVGKSRVEIFYLVDSFGSMYSEDIQSLMKKYTEALPGKTIGFHGHNNMQLGFANTIECIIQGARMLDATMLGMGRGAGNCPLELLLSFLKNPKYKVKPVLQTIQDYINPLQKQIDWGYFMPYMVSGSLNEHPRAAMAWMDSDKKDDYVGFYEEIMDTREDLK
ncbi:MAG: aldolase catalytic domain-containing protein [Salinivirgaceae bacterium]|jgi:4-hydroxy 2-oxovalerate aldolase|nr:aldolase catalytic domain-containing protein [Salinivirgaceae bacterium]